MLQHGSGVSVTKACQTPYWSPFGFTSFQLLGKTLSFTVNLSNVGCGCNLALFLVQGPAKDRNGRPSHGACSWNPYYCDSKQVCGQWCPEMDIMEANKRVFSTTPHKCDTPSPEGHYSNCDPHGCTRNTDTMGGDAYGPGAKYKIDSTHPFEVRVMFDGSGLQAGRSGGSFTGLTTTLQQGVNEVVLDFSSCRGYLGELAGVMAQGMTMHIAYTGKAWNASRMDPLCRSTTCTGDNAGNAIISNVRIKSSCAREIAISGLGTAAFVSGDGGSALGDRLTLKHNSGFSLTTTCQDHWDPNAFTLFKLLGRTLSFTVDLSGVGCGCNLALYLINGPAKDASGNPSLGTCPWSPYYCDANKVCGQYCPEVDIMEANSRAYASTPHKCDAPSNAGHYGNCDRNGCRKSTHGLDVRAYGPGAGYRINTMYPFHVHASFHSAPRSGAAGLSLSGMTVKLQQGSNEIVLDSPNCGKYLDSLTAPMMAGMVMRITYWGDDPETMSWLDQPPCGEQRCGGLNAGEAIISNMSISNITGDLALGANLTPGAPGAIAPQWVLLFVPLALLQCAFLVGMAVYAVKLYRHWHPQAEPGSAALASGSGEVHDPGPDLARDTDRGRSTVRESSRERHGSRSAMLLT